MLEDLSVKGLRKILTEVLTVEDYEKANYIKSLIKRKLAEPSVYSMDMKTQINHILDNFNFERVAAVMDFLDWTWTKNNKPIRDEDDNIIGFDLDCSVPTPDEMKHDAYTFLKKVWEADETVELATYSSGGFVAERRIYDGKKQLTLRFELAHWEMEYEAIRDPDYS